MRKTETADNKDQRQSQSRRRLHSPSPGKSSERSEKDFHSSEELPKKVYFHPHSSARASHCESGSSSKRRRLRNEVKTQLTSGECSEVKRAPTCTEQTDKNDTGLSDDVKEISSFKCFKYELSHVFFRGSDLRIDEDDFWTFVEKYINVQRKAAEKQCVKITVPRGTLGLPASYSKSHFVSMSLSASLDQLESRLPPRDRHDGNCVSRRLLAHFRDVLMLYLDFKQREKFTKLRKLRQSQKSLPVAHFREEIVAAVQKQRVVIIAGDTGCGKSTQIPQYLLAAGFKKIACTQPRRIACIALSKRVAFETLNEYGSEVGYQIRFERNKTQHTKIVFITEGLLLRQVSSDPLLSSYDVIVLDEVHERHLHGDFLLGVTKCLLHQRPDVKLVLMSATINIQLFQQYFPGLATIIQVPGRLYPISLHYRPVSIEEKSKKAERLNPAPYVRILQLIDEKYPKDEKGDLLIFLSGMSEISSVMEAAKLYAQQTQGWIVLSLHSSLSVEEQDKVFDYPPEGVRKCIISTNISETSITIDGIRFVVDSGKVKEMSYDPVYKMQRLKEFWISRASAEQRKGRAGRTGPGVCYRLYPEEEYQAMSAYTTPEIQRVPLDSLLLQMVAMGLPDARKFPFVEPPPVESIENSILGLKQQGALDDCERLTPLGQMLSKLPVDICLGKMLVMGSLFHQVEPVLSLVAALSVQTPFTNRAYRDPECETARKQLESDHGDPVTLLNAFREWLQEKAHSPGLKASKVWCRRRGLEEQRFYEMTKLRRQFKELLEDAGLLRSTSEHTTSSERAMRHGELKLLREMRREHRNTGPRKRRTLRLELWELGGDDQEEGGEVDMKDVEFRMSNSRTQVAGLLCGSTACSYRDVTMLKVILCSGLYPQLAVADELNYSKTASEQLFHTANKPYVALHPVSFFGNHPQVLQLEESDIVAPHGSTFTSKQPLSSKHQLLCYMSLLETTRPYLVNTLRMPAAQTLLLFSRTIDTNADFTRLVCDSWLQLAFAASDAAMVLLSKAVNLRTKWEQLLNLRLQATSNSVVDVDRAENEAWRLEAELSTDLPQFMHTEVFYSIKRLLRADIKVLFAGPGANSCAVSPNPLHPTWEAVPHPTKGGVRLSEYLTYNSLAGGQWELDLDTAWECPSCMLSSGLTPIERLQHRQTCSARADQGTKEVEEKPRQRKPNSTEYVCADCKTTLFLTPTEILKHRRQHLVKRQDLRV